MVLASSVMVQPHRQMFLRGVWARMALTMVTRLVLSAPGPCMHTCSSKASCRLSRLQPYGGMPSQLPLFMTCTKAARVWL